MTATPVWFGPVERPLFGWVHRPNDGRARAGVVLCPPFGRDYLQGHYALRRLAVHLEAYGFFVLRFDYDGTGDSAGDSRDPGRVEAWLASTGAAIEYVRHAGARQVALIGMRVGATLAATAAARDGGIESLVLWDPCASGRSFLHEQRVLTLVSLGISASRDDGSIETPAQVYDAETVRDLRELSIASTTGRLAGSVLALTRPNRTRDKDLVERLSVETVEWGDATGQEQLLETDAPHIKLPDATIDRIVVWLKGVTGTESQTVEAPVPASAAPVSITPSGLTVVERPVMLGPVGLFGIITEIPGTSDGPTVVFLTVAQEHHIGPNRLWVEYARSWAGSGMRALRVDLSGIGDSPVRAGQSEFVARPPEHLDDVIDVARAVSPRDASDVVLVGLCSGACQALDSAFGVRPRGVIAVNPVLSIQPLKVEAGAPDPRRRVTLPSTAHLEAFLKEGPLSKLPQRFPNVGARLKVLMAPSRRPAVWLRELVEADIDVLLVCGEWEARPFHLGTSSRTLAKLAASGHFRFEFIPNLSHGLLSEADRDRVGAILTEHMVQHFGPKGSSTGGLVSIAGTPTHLAAGRDPTRRSL